MSLQKSTLDGVTSLALCMHVKEMAGKGKILHFLALVQRNYLHQASKLNFSLLLMSKIANSISALFIF